MYFYNNITLIRNHFSTSKRRIDGGVPFSLYVICVQIWYACSYVRESTLSPEPWFCFCFLLFFKFRIYRFIALSLETTLIVDFMKVHLKFIHLKISIDLSSESAECTAVNKDSTNEDTENANNNANTTASSPVDKSQAECQTVSNNNWWGSWISSAKTKVNFEISKNKTFAFFLFVWQIFTYCFLIIENENIFFDSRCLYLKRLNGIWTKYRRPCAPK